MRPDYNQMSFTVLTMLLNTTSGIPNHAPPPIWPGPSRSIVQVQSILFASLLSALLAALLATLGKQWLNLHVQGSFIDRNLHREQKTRGMIAWRFKLVMECLPLIIQASLFLLGYALALYFWDISHIVSSVIAGFVVTGAVLYLSMVVAGTYSKTCPFQTPISVGIRAVLESHRENIVEASRAIRGFLGLAQTQTGLILHRQQLPTPPIASDIDDQDNEVRTELSCILTMFKMTKAPDSIKAIMAYITEIVWDDRLKSVPLLQVYQTLRESLLRSANGNVHPRQGARDSALWSAKALLHLYNQRRCIHPHDGDLSDQTNSINHRSQPLGHHGSDSDFDLQATFYIIDWTFGLQPEIPWSELRLSESHHCWLAHILHYRAWDVWHTQKKLTDDVETFVVDSLGWHRSPPRVIADCLSIVRMVAGYALQPRDLLIKDRRLASPGAPSTNADGQVSHQITEMIDEIFDLLENAYRQSAPGCSPQAVKALKLVVWFQDHRISARSYSLFKTIMDRDNPNGELWESARLSIQGAYSSPTDDVPQVGDPKPLLRFLDHHMSLSPAQRRDSGGTWPFFYVFSALTTACDQEADRGLAGYDFTSTIFIDTVVEALGRKDFDALRRSAMFILAKLDGHLFTSTNETFKDREKASRFVTAWSAAIPEFLGDPMTPEGVAVIKVLLAIAHLPCLRDHVPTKRWDLIELFPNIMVSNPPPLQRCLKDTNIIPFLKERIPDPKKPSIWLLMLWMMYHHLSKGVRQQLEEETRLIAGGNRCHHIGTYADEFKKYIENLKGWISALDPLDEDAIQMQDKRQQMVEARGCLLRIQENAKRNYGFGR